MHAQLISWNCSPTCYFFLPCCSSFGYWHCSVLAVCYWGWYCIWSIVYLENPFVMQLANSSSCSVWTQTLGDQDTGWWPSYRCMAGWATNLNLGAQVQIVSPGLENRLFLESCSIFELNSHKKSLLNALAVCKSPSLEWDYSNQNLSTCL